MPGSGLSFKKLDLHIHTPASQDFRDKNVTPKQIVDRAIDQSLDAIAITDHNSGAWIDCVKEAVKGTSLTVFPGVEISCNGGKGGIHILALFDVDKDSAHVAGLLSRLNIPPDDQGNTQSLAEGTLTSVIDEIQSPDWNGIAIPAHVTSSKGILEDIEGNPRTEVVRHPGLIAVEEHVFKMKHERKTENEQ